MRCPPVKAPRSPSKGVITALREVTTPKTTVLFIVSFLTPATAFMLYPFLTVYFTHRLGFSILTTGLLLSLRFLSSALLGFLGAAAANRFGLLLTYCIAAIVTAVTTGMMAYTQNLTLLIVLLTLMGVASSTTKSTLRGLASIGVPSDHQGLVQNIIHWLNNIGMTAALPLSAFIFHGGYSTIPFIVTATGYLAMAALLYGSLYRFSPVQSMSSPPAASPPPPRAPCGVSCALTALFAFSSCLLFCGLSSNFSSNRAFPSTFPIILEMGHSCTGHWAPSISSL